MRVIVHVREKCVPVSVGEGTQPVRWLANVGIARFDEQQGRGLGSPMGVKAEDGSLLNMGVSLIDAGIKDMQHVWVVLKGAAKRPHARHPGCSCHCTLLRLAGHLDDGELEPTSGRAAPKAALPAAAKGSMALAH